MRTLLSPLCRLWACALLFSGAAYGACLGEQNTTQTYSFEVVPQFTAAKVYSTWSPLLQRVGQETGMCFELRVAPNIPEFEQRLLKGESQFVYLNPYHAVLGYQKRKYQPCWPTAKICSLAFWWCAQTAHQNLGRPQRQNRVVSGTQRLCRIAADPCRTGKTQSQHQRRVCENTQQCVPLRHWPRRGSGRWCEQHPRQRSPRSASTVACAVRNTGLYAHPIATHPNVPVAVRERFFKAILKLTQDEEGRKLLDGVNLNKPQAVTYAKHYKPLESLQLEKFLVLTGP